MNKKEAVEDAIRVVVALAVSMGIVVTFVALIEA